MIDVPLALYITIVSLHPWSSMAEKKEIRGDESGRPPPSPFPHAATKFVLSLDGGGILGYSSLVILQALMNRVGQIERARNPKATSSLYSRALGPVDKDIHTTPASNATPPSEYRPCHYFDYIAGAGTGGISALILGRCRLSVAEAMAEYRNMCAIPYDSGPQVPIDAKVVERQRTWPQTKRARRHPIPFTNHSPSKSSIASKAKLVPAWPSPNKDAGNLASDPKRCRTLIYGSELQPLRSYPSPGSDPRSHAIDDIIKDCLREKPTLGSYIGARFYYTNPSRTVLDEVSSLSKPKTPNDYHINLLSLGAAVTAPPSARTNELQHLMHAQSSRVHEELSTNPRRRFKLNRYCRLDAPGHEFQDVGVREWQPGSLLEGIFQRVEEVTGRYLREHGTREEMEGFAEVLVERRRWREEMERRRRAEMERRK